MTPRSTPPFGPFQSGTSAAFTGSSAVTPSNFPERASTEATYQSAVRSSFNNTQESPIDESAEAKTQTMPTNADKSSSKPFNVAGAGSVDDREISGEPKDGVKLTTSMETEITPTMQLSLPAFGMPSNVRPALKVVAQGNSQASKVDRAASEAEASVLSGAISTDLKVIDQEHVPAISQNRSQSAPPDVPAGPAAQRDASPLILVSQESKDNYLFASGYNHKMFTEAAKSTGNEEIEESFDFKGYAGENLEVGSKEMANTVQASSISRIAKVPAKESTKDSKNPISGDEMMKIGEDEENVQATSKTTTPEISVPEVVAESIQKAASVIGEEGTKDLVMKDIDVNHGDVESKIPAQNLDVDASRASVVKSAIEQGPKGDANLTDGDVEMGDLDEVD
ncbi:hypothetical protein DL95DRAFT_458273 [Leptodontidium sp. 2 PMI_412]|nr:hypothetical protein DL95DRAFT_458273 [Leptodontidium sp. 2 PMI_412]